VVEVGIPLRLLGRHVAGGAEQLAGAGDRGAGLVGVEQLGDPEVEHLDEVGAVAAPGEEQVRGLEVAVDDVAGVRRREAAAGLDDERDRAPDRQRARAREQGRQILAFEVLHHQIGGAVAREAEVGHGGDVIVLERAGGARLALEARQHRRLLGVLGVQQLDREPPADQLGRRQDRPIPPAPSRRTGLAIAEHLADAPGLVADRRRAG
jgi:hypothetical protein